MATIYQQCDTKAPHTRHEWNEGDDRIACDGAHAPRCPNCDGSMLSTTIDKMVTGAAGHGMLSAHDVKPVVVIGCDECSETVEILQTDDPRVTVTVSL